MIRCRRMLYPLLLAVWLLPLGCAAKQTPQTRPLRVLFVGNSYTTYNDLPGIVERLAASHDPPLEIRTESATANGAAFQTHWNDDEVRRRIRSGPWDFVVLQEQSLTPIRAPEKTREFGAKLVQEVQAVEAEPVLFMTWARAGFVPMTEAFAKEFGELAEEHGARMSPIGLAWAAVREQRPDIQLYAADKSHPAPAGSYLTGCVLFATITGLDPVGLGTAGIEGLSDEDRLFLQQTAKDPRPSLEPPPDRESKRGRGAAASAP